MHVSSQTLRSALLRIFADAGNSAREGLNFPDIARRWAATGLRDSDLRAAVHELLESGELLSLQRDGILSFALNSAPECYGSELQLGLVESTRQGHGGGADPVLRYRMEDLLE